MKWQEFTLVDCTKEFPIGPAEVPKMEGLLGKESYFLGLFGTTGLTGKIFSTVTRTGDQQTKTGRSRIHSGPGIPNFYHNFIFKLQLV